MPKPHFLLVLNMLMFFLASTAVVATPAGDSLQLPTDKLKNYTVKVAPDASLGSLDSGIGLRTGEAVPFFALTTHDNKPVDLPALLNKAPLLVVFYRGGWCPYCNLQIRELSEAYDEFEQRGITPVLISVDKTDGAALAQKTYDIPFPVLSDPDLKAHEAFEVVMQIDDDTYEKYKTYGIVLDSWSGRDHHKIAVSSAFIVDNAGVVQWAHASKDYQTRPSVAQLLDVIDRWRR